MHSCSDAVHIQAPSAHCCRKCPRLSLSWTTIFSGVTDSLYSVHIQYTSWCYCPRNRFPAFIYSISEQAPIHFAAKIALAAHPQTWICITCSLKHIGVYSWGFWWHFKTVKKSVKWWFNRKLQYILFIQIQYSISSEDSYQSSTTSSGSCFTYNSLTTNLTLSHD